MKVLFITSNRLGDAVLSTGLLCHIAKEYPQARITVACGPLGQSIFESMPNVDNVIVFDKQSYSRHWLYLWNKCFKTRWDIIVDIRNSLVSRLLLGKQKFIWHSINKEQHKVEQMAELMQLDYVPSPNIYFSTEQNNKAKKYIPESMGAVLAIGPAANWIGKTWDAENFAELALRLTSEKGVLPNACVAVLAAPNEEEIAYKVLNKIPKERQVDVIAKLNPGDSAAVLSRAALYIGNDSGLMHCASAVGIPTVGLFGPGYPEQYRPWGGKSCYVSTPETADEIFNRINIPDVTESLMKTLTVDMVEKTTQEHFAKLRGFK